MGKGDKPRRISIKRPSVEVKKPSMYNVFSPSQGEPIFYAALIFKVFLDNDSFTFPQMVVGSFIFPKLIDVLLFIVIISGRLTYSVSMDRVGKKGIWRKTVENLLHQKK